MCKSSSLERSDSIIVNSCHLILCQSVSSLVVNLKTSIELKHVQELGKKDGHPLLYEQDWKGNSEPKRGSHPGWY